jgi:AcrR family transcriptional regulator
MPRQRQEEVNEATRSTIKSVAQQLMAEQGTAGLSLRAIARRLELTAPALYHYFASLDELITALIVDAFTGHAAYVRQVRDEAARAGQSYAQQLFAAALAYRQWALENPLNFQLIYGNPIPGYIAPAEVTTPAARSVGEIFIQPLLAAVRSGEITIAEEYREIPPTIQAHYRHRRGMEGDLAVPFHVMNYVWSMMHGLVTLEINHHAAPVVGDTTAFYEQALRRLFQSLGIALTA